MLNKEYAAGAATKLGFQKKAPARRVPMYKARRSTQETTKFTLEQSDDDDSAHRLGEFIKDMKNIEKVELLPYHELGKHKWVALGEEYKLDGIHPPSKETMENVKAIIASYGHKVMY